jgi:hypothetical protein
MELQGTVKKIFDTQTGDNLWLQTKRNGFNPTTSETGNSNTYTYSPLSTITFGVKANF